MNILRLISIIFLLTSTGLVVLARDKPPEPTTWNENLKELLYDEDEIILDGSDFFSLQTPYRALDAAIVPITVEFKQDQKIDKHVKSLILIVDENPSPVVSKFKFNTKTGNASLTTRIRVDKYTYVRVIAEMNDNSKYMVANYVKAAGGCSAPSLGDIDSIMARLGKMKMKFIKTGEKDSINKAEFLISHPNFSGLQFNQLTRSEIPAHFVNSVVIKQDDEIIFEAFPDISLSEDPSFIFNYRDSGGPLVVDVEDSDGQKFSAEFSSSNIALSE